MAPAQRTAAVRVVLCPSPSLLPIPHKSLCSDIYPEQSIEITPGLDTNDLHVPSQRPVLHIRHVPGHSSSVAFAGRSPCPWPPDTGCPSAESLATFSANPHSLQ